MLEWLAGAGGPLDAWAGCSGDPAFTRRKPRNVCQHADRTQLSAAYRRLPMRFEIEAHASPRANTKLMLKSNDGGKLND